MPKLIYLNSLTPSCGLPDLFQPQHPTTGVAPNHASFPYVPSINAHGSHMPIHPLFPPYLKTHYSQGIGTREFLEET